MSGLQEIESDLSDDWGGAAATVLCSMACRAGKLRRGIIVPFQAFFRGIVVLFQVRLMRDF